MPKKLKCWTKPKKKGGKYTHCVGGSSKEKEDEKPLVKKETKVKKVSAPKQVEESPAKKGYHVTGEGVRINIRPPQKWNYNRTNLTYRDGGGDRFYNHL